MYTHIFEVVFSGLALTSAGFSYYMCRASMRYNELCVQAAKLAVINSEIARARALDAAKSNTLAGTAVIDARVHAGVAGVHARVAESHVQLAASHAAAAESFQLAAKEHVIEAAEQVDAAAGHVQTAQSFSVTAREHAETSASHAQAAMSFSVTAAQHVEAAAAHVQVAGEQARSVGSLYTAVADIAGQTKVRLVSRTDYSTDGSNIGGR
jgi:hypothetical protein